MAGIDLATAEAKLREYLDAETALLGGGQSYQIKDRTFTRADLAEIRNGIEYWNDRVQRLSQAGRGPRVFGVTPY